MDPTGLMGRGAVSRLPNLNVKRENPPTHRIQTVLFQLFWMLKLISTTQATDAM